MIYEIGEIVEDSEIPVFQGHPSTGTPAAEPEAQKVWAFLDGLSHVCTVLLGGRRRAAAVLENVGTDFHA